MTIFGRVILGLAAAMTMLVALPFAAEGQRPPPPDLPDIPGTPVMSGVTYPACRYDYRLESGDNERAAETTTCIQRLDEYHDNVLAAFRTRMIAHQEEIGRLYTEEVMNDFRYTQDQADGFFARTTAEHEASNPDGAHFETWRALEAQYQDDRAYLQERFCRYAGTCNSWSPTDETAARDREDGVAERRERSASRHGGARQCDTGRAGGSIIGGILGGIIGEATGIGAVAGALAGAASGLLVAEIACQLQPEEQELAAEATAEVTQAEEVGATATWISPTRADVSGTSTVTALVSQPSGGQCMDVTDIIIVEGEETRISKRMCRAEGETRYVLAA
ncbi:MAG: hypothetical protein HKN78_01775 [Sphingomonadaceae bacterium]|nr:hypothetical protein [Sphingomonadaceae bacterium]